MSFQAMTWAVEQELPVLQKMVLLMLSNCCNHHSGQCNPSHERLAKECGMGKTSVKDAIRALSEKGLLEVVHRSEDGVSLPNQYKLNLSTGVVRNATGGGTQCDGGVGRPATTKQEVKPGIETKTIRATRFDAQAHLLSLGVDPQVSEDWLSLRKSKRLPATKTAIDGVQRESLKARLSMDAAIRECCSRGWAGFKAEWVQNTNRKESWSEQNDRVLAELTGRNRQNEPDDGYIDV